MYLVLNIDLGDILYIRMNIEQESIGIIPSNQIIGITDKRREEYEQYISTIEEIHFRNDNGKDATELHTYLSNRLLFLRERWNFNLTDYTLLIEEFGTPFGSVLSNLYFALVESFSGLMSVNDSVALCNAFLDTYPDRNIKDSKFWKKEFSSIEEKDIIQILDNIPLSLTREFRLQVFSFFLRPFVPYSYIDPLPLSPDAFLLQKKAESWIATLKIMIEREEKLIAAKGSQEKENMKQKSETVDVEVSTVNLEKIKQSHLIFALHETNNWRTSGLIYSKVVQKLMENFLDENGIPFIEKSLLSAMSKSKPKKCKIDISQVKSKLDQIFFKV